MNILFLAFKIIASACSIYSFLIFIRIMITWFPGAALSPIGSFLGSICDPFIGWFARFRFFRTARLDFTPLLAIGSLMIVSSVFTNFAVLQRLGIGIVIGTTLRICWSFFSSLLTFLNIFVCIRLVFLFIKRDSARFWQQLDSVISPIAYKLTSLFWPRTIPQYRYALLVALVFGLITQFGIGWLIRLLAALLFSLPI